MLCSGGAGGSVAGIKKNRLKFLISVTGTGQTKYHWSGGAGGAWLSDDGGAGGDWWISDDEIHLLSLVMVILVVILVLVVVLVFLWSGGADGAGGAGGARGHGHHGNPW